MRRLSSVDISKGNRGEFREIEKEERPGSEEEEEVEDERRPIVGAETEAEVETEQSVEEDDVDLPEIDMLVLELDALACCSLSVLLGPPSASPSPLRRSSWTELRMSR